MAKHSAKSYSAALRALAGVPAQMASRVAVRISAEIQREFDEGRTAYGTPWAPLRPKTIAKGRHAPPLTDTREGRDSVTVQPAQGAGVTISVGASYMAYHQDGTSHMVARKILPEGILPAAWKRIYQSELTAGCARVMGNGK